MNHNNPPPSKLLRTKLASVNTSRRGAKNTKNLCLNVNVSRSAGLGLSTSTSPPKHHHHHHHHHTHNNNNNNNTYNHHPFHYQHQQHRAPKTSVEDFFPAFRSSPPSSTTTTPSPLQSPTKSDYFQPAAKTTATNMPEIKRRPSAALSISIPDDMSRGREAVGSPSVASRPAPPPPPSSSATTATTTNKSNTVIIPASSSLVSPGDKNQDKDAYPEGPVLVCPPNVYLYSEPSLDVAYKYDVVINVAKEVNNPFATTLSCSPLSQNSSNASTESDFCSSPTDGVAVSGAAEGAATNSTTPPSSVESTPDLSESPSKPVEWCSSSSSSSSPSEPEYIYVPWDHNSKLVAELECLTNIIANRSAQGKNILIHCQCGVSRSASLVVAYIMKVKGWDVNTAYDFVKERSPNISPNMTLMFQLIDWQNLLKQETPTPTTAL